MQTLMTWPGSEFRGFHIRFHDVARGGIRIVRSSRLKMVDIGEGQHMYRQGKKLYPARYRQAFKDKL